MPAFDDYTPQELEPGTRKLTALLEHVYQQPIDAPLIAETEQQRILARARARLGNAELNPRTRRENAHPPLFLLDPVEYADVASLPAQPARPLRRSRFSRLFNAFAAIWVIGLLLAGSTLLLTYRSSGGGTHISTMCPSDMFSLSGEVSLLDYTSLNYICVHHLYQNLNIERTQGKYRVTLIYTYADQSQIIIWYRVETKINGSYQLTNTTVEADGGAFGPAFQIQITSSGSSSPLPHEGVSSSADGKLAAMVISLMPSHLQEAPPVGPTLNVQINDIVLFSDGVRGITFPLQTRLTIPVAGTWHSVSLQQTQMATGSDVTGTNTGYPLMLESVGYSLSKVTVFINYSDLPGSWQQQLSITSFRVGKLECANPSRVSGPEFSGFYLGLLQSFDCSLPANGIAPGSEVTLVVSLSPKTTWTFHFALP